MDDFKQRFCTRGPFAHGLFPNCGNGWVERDFIDRGIVRRATAFDYAQDLLDQAETARGSRQVDYFQADANRVELPAASFDLVVNVGALHHVQYIDRLARQLCAALTDHGVLVGFDYVGPARNQYPRAHWRLVAEANRSLPGWLRVPFLRRAHLPTMLVDDPTEAIHSDLVLDVLARYFRVEERHDLGGGIAYPLITHNERFFDPARTDAIGPHLERLLERDRELTADGRVPSLFAYYMAHPDKVRLDGPQAGEWEAAEASREAWAAAHGGTYRWLDYAAVRAESVVWRLVDRFHLHGLRTRLRQALR
jgi:SAM-dependent methyltransferase